MLKWSCRETKGSPPRWRGKAVKFRFTCGLQRITPAWAGKRTLHRFHRLACRDHPRMGGEKIASCTVCRVSMGSPPHGRGKAKAYLEARFALRITPAWAGKSRWGRSSSVCCWDHPRMGEEKSTPPQLVIRRRGSPPHGRGKVAGPGVALLHPGITPAWAGKRAVFR